MITRRQFLTGCIGAIAAVSGSFFISDYKRIDDLINSIPVLLYHRVGPESDALTITSNRFEHDMETLSQEGYTTVSLEQIRQHLQKKLTEQLPEKPILLTFDDSYLDNYTNAFPILQKYSMKASFFVITGMVGQNDRLTISQIREMQAAGMDFGSHTVSHRSLAELNAKDIKLELNKSKYYLEQIVGKSINFIAYPCGSYTSETLKIAHETGYDGGFSLRPGFAIFNNSMIIRRIPIFHYDRSISYVMLKKGLLPTMFG